MEPEGNLLEGADLTHEWSLPALPADNSSHPSSSQELADIFGTSDDEDEGTFPFSSHLTVPKTFEDITLTNKNYTSSLLGNVDSELFLAGFEPKTDSPVKQEPSPAKQHPRPAVQEPEKEVPMETTDNEATSTEPESTSVPDNSSGNRGNTPAVGEEDHTPQETTDNSNETNEPQSTEEIADSGQPRKSARLQAKKPIDDEFNDPALMEALALSQQQQEATPPEVQPSAGEPVAVDPPSESESEDSDEEDPNKLYCICRRPHNDKFMICCDSCEDWFHGSCVGITVSQGKKMEREGKEYVCPVCSEKQGKSKEEIAAGRTARQSQRELTRDKAIKKKLAALGVIESPIKKRRTSGEGDSYGLNQLFLPDNAPKGGEVTSTSDHPQEEFIVNKCIVSECEKNVTPPSIYCSQDCIEKHVTVSLRKLVERGVNVASNPSDLKGSGGIVVVDRALNRVMVGSNAPSEQELLPWLVAHPSFQVLIPGRGKKKDKFKSPSKFRHEIKREEVKYPKIALMDPDSVRANAKKALFQILWKRREEAPDMSDVGQAEVEKIAHDIEEKLFNLNQDINPKYKNKYRSLIFNLKDTKNQGLFRKVLRREFSSKELVRMTIEKLASDDLAAWRHNTLKKDLEMIKAREEEAGALGEVIRKTTHKGEVEIDSSVIREKIIDEVPAAEGDPAKADNKPSSKTKPKSDPKTPDTTSSPGILALLKNSTSEHGKHLYDQHCDVCTGKIPAPSSSPIQSPDSHMTEDMDTSESKM